MLKMKENTMTRFMTSTVIAALTIGTAMPAFADGHSDTSMMTCAAYNDLPEDEKKLVAVAAISELSTSSDATIAENNGTATATDATEGTDGEESAAGSTNTVADNNGTATATSSVGAGDDMSEYEERVQLLNLTCERNIDATVQEAVSGMSGTR